MAGHRFRVGQIAGTSRSAKGMTGRRTRPEVVHCPYPIRRRHLQEMHRNECSGIAGQTCCPEK
jgi:hypothetical protein